MTTSSTPVPAEKTNIYALVGMICSLAGLLVGFPAAVVGIVFGHLGLNAIKKTGEQGRGMAITALAVGYAQIALAVLGVLALIVITLVFGWAWWQHGFDMPHRGDMMVS